MKENYMSVSILPVLSKIFEVSLSIQVSDYFEDIFVKQQCGFRKGYNNLRCLLKLLQKWGSSIGRGRVFGALLTDLSKTFDYLDHELLLMHMVLVCLL